MLHIFSMKDKPTGAFMNPFFAAHAAVALRMMSDVGSDPATILSKHPDDFALYRLGSFEPESGVIYPEVVPVFIQDLAALLRKKESNEKP